ncbi:MAG: putative inorganic carbon transporter subunit DabA, partial [Variovorax sp.]
LATSAPWSAFQRLPASGFTLVESVGGTYLGKLLGRSGVLGRRSGAGAFQAPGLSAAEARRLRPAAVPGHGAQADAQRVQLALGILRAMGLTTNFARLVLVAGHAAHSANNPQLAALQCGACGGHGGDVNARALALLLNDAAVRRGLAAQGLHIPPHTHFLAGVHNTTTDDVSLLDTDLLPPGHAADVQALRADLESAGRKARAWRAPRLGLAHLGDQPRALERALRERAQDWAQTRPEWGLANNAAFIVAPRRRTRGADLEGRAFLHEYDAHADADGAVLAQILAGPMVVGHWINMQYYASTVDPQGLGSGNKLLHNVVGGRIGVFEGNGGDLRIGLAWQSVHDGERWMHTPLRLSVLIDAPRERIERVLAADATVRRLVEHRWLHLLRFVDGDATPVDLETWQHGQWQAMPARGD